MKLTQILFAIAITLFFYSCQKAGVEDIVSVTPDTASFLVRTYTEEINFDTIHLKQTYNLNYDASNRLISMISATSPGDRFEYKYNANTVTMDLYNSNAVSIHEIIFLNSNSYIDSTFQYNDTGDTSTEKYIYNSNKQLITSLQYDYASGVSDLFDTDHYLYNADGTVKQQSNSTVVYTFDYTTILNTLNVGLELTPKEKYLVKTTHYTSGTVSLTQNHTYTFDAKNRLTSEKIEVSTGGTITKTYTY